MLCLPSLSRLRAEGTLGSESSAPASHELQIAETHQELKSVSENKNSWYRNKSQIFSWLLAAFFFLFSLKQNFKNLLGTQTVSS